MSPSLTTADLKGLLHGDYTRLDKLLFLLASIGQPCQVAEIRARAQEAGYRIPKTWNVSSSLGRSGGKAIRVPSGWEIADAGQQHLIDLGVSGIQAQSAVATDLRATLSNIQDVNVQSFVEEAVICHEGDLHRSAIVMSWVGAVAVLHSHIHTHHLQAFNAEAKRRNPKWKDATTTDELGRMRESEFLDVICSLSVIGPNVKAELKSCLGRRNACGHPSSLRVGPNTAAHHLEVLLLNVFTLF